MSVQAIYLGPSPPRPQKVGKVGTGKGQGRTGSRKAQGSPPLDHLTRCPPPSDQQHACKPMQALLISQTTWLKYIRGLCWQRWLPSRALSNHARGKQSPAAALLARSLGPCSTSVMTRQWQRGHFGRYTGLSLPCQRMQHLTRFGVSSAFRVNATSA